MVSAKTKNETSEIAYYAHTAIDEVYGMEGNWGLTDKSGNTLIKPEYLYPFIKYGDNYQVMKPHEYKIINNKKTIITLKHGLIDKQGNVIIPFIIYIWKQWITQVPILE